MNVLFFIGNGFDIEAGLKTKASSIVSEYRISLTKRAPDMEPDDPRLIMKASIDQNSESWADFEKMLGMVTKKFTKCDDFKTAFRDFRKFLKRAIEERNAWWSREPISANLLEDFPKNLTSKLSSGFNKADADRLNNYLLNHRTEDRTYDFASFNYTGLLDALVNQQSSKRIAQQQIGSTMYSRELGEVFHVHGEIEDFYGIILGVDNESQIANEEFRKDAELIDLLVKPHHNDRLGEQRNEKLKKMIADSSIIFIYGMSIGVTDKSWWQEVWNWLKESEDRLLIINDRSEAYSSGNGEEIIGAKDNCKSRFAESAGADINELEILNNRILVAANSSIFSLDFPWKNSGLLSGSKQTSA